MALVNVDGLVSRAGDAAMHAIAACVGSHLQEAWATSTVESSFYAAKSSRFNLELIGAEIEDYYMLRNVGGDLEAIDEVLVSPLLSANPPDWMKLKESLIEYVTMVCGGSFARRFDAVDRGELFGFDDWTRDLAIWELRVKEHLDKKTHEESIRAKAAEEEAANRQRPFSHLQGTPVSLSDDVAESDLLGRTPLINALTRMFMAPQQGTPFTIALLANWGAGKSSVLNLVKKKIQERARQRAPDSPGYREFDFAMFNAWEYEKTDSIAAGLAQEVVRGITNGVETVPPKPWWFGEKRWHWLQKLWLVLQFSWKEYRAKVILRSLTAVGLIGVVLLLCCSDTALYYAKLFLLPKQDAGISALVILGMLLAACYQGYRNIVSWCDDTLLQQFDTYLNLPKYSDQLGLIPQLSRQLDVLCGLRYGADHKRRLIVFVDDLDRCNTECIVNTFDAVRLVMDRKDVIVVIAIDPRIALKAIAEHYEKLADEPGTGKGRTKEEIARDYLGKIIQLPVQLSPPHPENLSEFIQQRLFPDVDMTDVPNTSRDLQTVTETSSSGSVRPVTSTEQASGEMNERLTDAEKRAELDLKLTERDRTAAIEPAERITTAEEDAHILQETPDEVRVFTKLASGLDIHNPRRLTRLRNSYRLLKFIVAEKPSLYDGTPVQDGDEMARCTFLLNALFWFEFIGQCSREDRAACEGHIAGKAEILPRKIRDTWTDQETEDIGIASSSPLFHQIRALVLPHDIAGHNGYADGEAE